MDNQQATSVSRAPRPFFSLYNLARFGFFLFGIPKNSFGSVDVTNQCNLRCNHCYFFEQDHSGQWPLEQWREQFERMKADGFSFYHCTWVGGEPLLRPEIIELGRHYFKNTTDRNRSPTGAPLLKKHSHWVRTGS